MPAPFILAATGAYGYGVFITMKEKALTPKLFYGMMVQKKLKSVAATVQAMLSLRLPITKECWNRVLPLK